MFVHMARVARIARKPLCGLGQRGCQSKSDLIRSHDQFAARVVRSSKVMASQCSAGFHLTVHAYETSWARFDEHGVPSDRPTKPHRLARRRRSPCCRGVWDSEEDMNAFTQVPVELIAEADMKLAGPPEVGELLNVVRPE